MRSASVQWSTLAPRARTALTEFAEARPARFAIIVFLLLVVAVTVVLSTPWAAASGTSAPLVDALFTAVSAICVTGLSSVDHGTFWSPFGHGVVLVAVEIGAVGVLTLASVLGLAISRRLGLRQKLLAASDSNPLRMNRAAGEGQAVRLGDIGSLLRTIAASLLVIEAAVAVLMLPSMIARGMSPGDALAHAVYYSVMSFTNSGFAPDAEGLTPYAHDYWFLSVMMVAVFLGAVGFPVILVVLKRMRRPATWSLHAKLTLAATAVLFVLGGIVFLLLEAQNPRTLAGLDPVDRIFQPFFLSMMTRSGGFSIIDPDALNGSSKLVADMLMFIGGGSASTAGGIKVTTLAVLFLAAAAEARGNESMEAFGRRIPDDVLRLAVSVGLWGATTVATASIIILQLTGQPLDRVLFDVISAFATSGLSTGLTAQLPDAGLVVLAITMFMGRVGTVTLAAALAASSRRRLFRRPEERPIVG